MHMKLLAMKTCRRRAYAVAGPVPSVAVWAVPGT